MTPRSALCAAWTVLVVLERHATNFGWSLRDFMDPGRVLVHGRNLRRLDDLLDEIEGRVHRGHTSAAVDADVARWCAEAREILNDAYHLHERANVVPMRREEVG